jgi:hypothetical protein
VLLAAVVLIAAGGTARAQSEIVSRDAFHGLADVRLAAVDGERGWTDGGFGKTQVEDDGPVLSEIAVAWTPHFNFAFSAVVSAEYQPQVSPELDVGEVYLKYQAPPNRVGRINARAGILYPPVSLEHSEPLWSTRDTLSASAINSWIGEEVKVAGLEASLERDLAGHGIKGTVGVFGANDTSATLLTFRGWALHGLKAGPHTAFDLPPLSNYMVTKQAGETDPMLELDGRPGLYGRLEWRPPGNVVLDAFFYDNGGNRTAVRRKQWSWETRFFNMGVRWDLDERTRVLAQAVTGETLMGYRPAGGHWVDMGFQAAYVLAARDFGPHTLTGRLDWFEANDRTFVVLDNNDEQGWAVTAAWRHHLSDYADVVVEAMHVQSDRPSRALAMLSAEQDQTTLQAALRLGF